MKPETNPTQAFRQWSRATAARGASIADDRAPAGYHPANEPTLASTPCDWPARKLDTACSWRWGQVLAIVTPKAPIRDLIFRPQAIFPKEHVYSVKAEPAVTGLVLRPSPTHVPRLAT